jgi:hypothetical protein
MQRIGPIAAASAVAIGIAALSGVALANGHGTKPAAAPAPAPKVYICHATGSASNPYVLIHVSSNALPAHQNGRDIVLGSSPGACPHPSPAPQVSAVSAATHVESTPAQTESTTVEPKQHESADNETETETDNEQATPPQTKESDDAESDSSESDHVQSTSEDDHSESGD